MHVPISELLYYAFTKYVVAEKNVCLCSRTRILTDSARKRNRKEVLRIIIKKKLP
jgi:hypothetical protein